MKAVVDTNVVVSSFLSPTGTRARILKGWEKGQFELIVSDEILAEYERALNYQEVSSRHGMTIEQIGQVIAEMKSFATVVKPQQKLIVIKDDPADDKFLECAKEAGAEYIVSADLHLLNLKQYEDVQILSPSEFLSVIDKTCNLS